MTQEITLKQNLSMNFYNDFCKSPNNENEKYKTFALKEEQTKSIRMKNLYYIFCELEDKAKREKNIPNNSEKIEVELKEIDSFKKKLEPGIKGDDKYDFSVIDEEEIKNEMFPYIMNKYCKLAIRSEISRFQTMIPFIKENFGNKANNIINNIENSIFNLFNPDSLPSKRMNAKENLKKDLNLIKEKYLEKNNEKKISGSYFWLSSICSAQNEKQLDKAIESHIGYKLNRSIFSQQKLRIQLGDKELYNDNKYKKIFRGIGDIKDDNTMNNIKNGEIQNFNRFPTIFDLCGAWIDIFRMDGIAGQTTSFSWNPNISLKNFTEGNRSALCVFSLSNSGLKSTYLCNWNEEEDEVNGYKFPAEYMPFIIICEEIDEKKRPVDVWFNPNADVSSYSLDKEYKNQEELKKMILEYEDIDSLSETLNNLKIERIMDKGKEFDGEEKQQNLNDKEKLEKLSDLLKHIEEIENNNKNNYNKIISAEENTSEQIDEKNDVKEESFKKKIEKTQNSARQTDKIFNDNLFMRLNGIMQVNKIFSNQIANRERFKYNKWKEKEDNKKIKNIKINYVNI